MNPFTLIGFFLVLFCATKYVNAVPVTSDATNLAVTAENLTTVRNDEEKLDNLLYNIGDSINASENESFNEVTIAQTTRKPQSTTQKPNTIRRRRVIRRRPRKQPDCRSMTTEKPITPKPTQIVNQFPSLFISGGWGPGR